MHNTASRDNAPKSDQSLPNVYTVETLIQAWPIASVNSNNVIPQEVLPRERQTQIENVTTETVAVVPSSSTIFSCFSEPLSEVSLIPVELPSHSCEICLNIQPSAIHSVDVIPRLELGKRKIHLFDTPATKFYCDARVYSGYYIS